MKMTNTLSPTTTSKHGFTLIELLMVLAIIAVIAMLAVNKYGDLGKNARKNVNVANLTRIASGIEAYIAACATEDSKPSFDKLDSLTLFDNHAAGTGGDTSNLAAVDKLLLYTNQVGNVGLSTSLFGSTNPWTNNREMLLGTYYLSDSDVTVLRDDLGIKFTMAGTDGVMSRQGDDGVWAQGDISNPLKCSSVATSNYVGRAVAIVNPGATSGRTPVGPDIYKSIGADVAYSYSGKILVGGVECSNNKEAFEKLMVGDGILMAFGLGDNCALVGNALAGFNSAPVSPVMDKTEYRNYIVLVRVKYTAGRNTFTAKSAEYAGVMDPNGNVLRQLR